MTLNSGTFEARLYKHAHRLLKTHETLLRDKVRNAAFYEALKKSVKPGDVVLDVFGEDKINLRVSHRGNVNANKTVFVAEFVIAMSPDRRTCGES